MNKENDLKVPPEFILFLILKSIKWLENKLQWLKFQFLVEDCINKLAVYCIRVNHKDYALIINIYLNQYIAIFTLKTYCISDESAL